MDARPSLIAWLIVVCAMYALVAWSLCDPFFPWRHRPVTACTVTR